MHCRRATRMVGLAARRGENISRKAASRRARSAFVLVLHRGARRRGRRRAPRKWRTRPASAGATTAEDGKLRGKNDVCGVRCSFQSGAHAISDRSRRLSQSQHRRLSRENWKTWLWVRRIRIKRSLSDHDFAPASSMLRRSLVGAEFSPRGSMAVQRISTIENVIDRRFSRGMSRHSAAPPSRGRLVSPRVASDKRPRFAIVRVHRVGPSCRRRCTVVATPGSVSSVNEAVFPT